ncbi:hypothetical protein [Brevibacillus invocatus]|uniref:hypothetical protein n=1 Tax=Brevibacillus invocatus TaxID=173959 RepID=UPI00203F2331|nr:hypothetical protein [Brevibacillus invocatus]MCM3079732.1 hypothetical protein [Brevibacillus invocatus]MCM3429926.1 hypothetical protein [Brevibacillus invocatus]
MKPNKYIEKLKQIDTLSDLIKQIKLIFENFEDDNYIPAIIEEGSFTIDHGEDLYVKLVLKHQTIEINETWLKDNMAFGLDEPTTITDEVNEAAFIHNIITYRKYKSRNLYQLNPLLISDQINEYEYTNSDYVNAFFNDEYSNLQGLPVLKSTNDIKLLVLKKVFNSYINDPESNIYPKFELVAEFEYRTHNNHFVDLKSESNKLTDAFLKVDKADNKIYILGSIKISLPNKEGKQNSRNIQVIDLGDFKARNHNPGHYNGDTIEGFICFKPEVLNVLKDFYYFYDLQMIDKNNLENSYLVDVLKDKVVFWEAEYNKLPTSIKDKIDKYNFVPQNTKSIISPAMSAMQLEVDWNWDQKLTPEYLLANLIRERAFNRAIDLGLSFIEPQNAADLKEFIIKIESLTNIRLERFNLNSEEVRQLINIRDGGSWDIPSADLKLLYLKYCYAIQMEYRK